MSAFYKEGLKAPKEKSEKKTELVLEASADLRPKDLKIDNEPDNGDTLIDDDNFFLEDDNLKEKDKKLILDLIDKTDFSYLGKIDYDEKPKMAIEKPKTEIKLDYILLQPPLKMEEDEKKLNEIVQ